MTAPYHSISQTGELERDREGSRREEERKAGERECV